VQQQPQHQDHTRDGVRELARRRREVLLAAGYPRPLAADIACSEADMRVAVELMAHGCDAETATEIVI
jgi:hypothetical protein